MANPPAILASIDVVEALRKAVKKYDVDTPKEILEVLGTSTIAVVNLLKGNRAMLEIYIRFLEDHKLDGEYDS